MKHLRPALMITVIFVIVTGFIYPAIVTGLGQLLFHNQANGSIHMVNGKAVGSDLIGQQWSSAKYFHGRPSVTINASTGTPQPYSADNSSGSNLGPTNGSLLNGNGSQVTIADGTPVPANATPVAGQKNTYTIPGSYAGVNNYADQFRKENHLSADTKVPSDMVTASASGLDPDISPESAYLQVDRVAQERGLDPAKVKQLVTDHIDGRFLWIFGEPHVNVLNLNIALDQLQ
ncbi:potassium-transporting ATPase subunit C [Tengunoibacter tsumagoiensis]|uniref:Potassium-transporting ATPase KdpC subunit n=1 Tax=Tengunoibacter tsumagoiensis TaxID=2014871 RepID=A0A402A3E0_9CHLR|nr:potassium-transporting ATPase subunit C [Tengunoibacter tsumagoiensis]GCE13670.1 potassium-transporting ATPase KdpC subunit [Tengunoibacter tsumagoiensis]